MPLYLLKQGRLPVPLLFISRYILEHRDEYYKLLRNVTYKNQWMPWVLYIIRATTVQARYTCEILGKIKDTTENVRQTLQKNLRPIYSAELVDFLFL